MGSEASAILPLVERQVALGARVPGTAAHDALAAALERELRARTATVLLQEFPVRFHGTAATCRNVLGVFPARAGGAGGPPVLLGTHYDTRPRADREPRPEQRGRPIPGANDGGSGTAILLHLLDWLAAADLERDVVIAFLDAEDLGDIDGNPFSLGAERLADRPPPGMREPGQVVVLDMVGGRRMRLDVDAHALGHAPSHRLTAELFACGQSLDLEPFTARKPNRVKWIISDQWAFLRRGIASCLLIDIDYPQWHTQADLPAAMCEESLVAIEAALRSWLSPRGAGARPSSGASGGP